MEKRSLSPLAVILKWSVLVLLVLDAAATLSLPWWLKAFFMPRSIFGKAFGDSAAVVSGDYTLLLVFLFICGVCGFCMLLCAFSILNRMVSGNLFDGRNAQGLRRMALLSLMICIATVAKLCRVVTLYSVLFLIVFLFAALFLFFLSELFVRASEIEEENSLMI